MIYSLPGRYLGHVYEGKAEFVAVDGDNDAGVVGNILRNKIEISIFCRHVCHGFGGGHVIMPFVVVEFRLVFGRREVQNLRPGHRSLIVGIQCDFTLPLDTSHRDVRNLVALSFDPESDFRHDGSKLQSDRFLAIPDIQNRSRKTKYRYDSRWPKAFRSAERELRHGMRR